MFPKLWSECKAHIPSTCHVWGILVVVRNDAPQIMVAVIDLNDLQGWGDFRNVNFAGGQWQYRNGI